ncbi:Scube3 [Scenedesmus sp. PABB004]|nr:Scube3 [Scenedesmus sp. PABB004]
MRAFLLALLLLAGASRTGARSGRRLAPAGRRLAASDAASVRDAAASGSGGGGGSSIGAAECRSRTHPACARCSLAKAAPGTSGTSVVCAVCDPTWQLKRGPKPTCECVAGRYQAAGACPQCPKGQFCLGRAAAPADCPEGLATTVLGARSSAQCYSTPGYGRVAARASNGAITYQAALCDPGTYSAGGTTIGCSACAAGLTTLAVGATSAGECVAPAGSYVANGAGKLCPRGTYSREASNATACTPCSRGLATAGEGASTPDDCTLATPGYYVLPLAALQALFAANASGSPGSVGVGGTSLANSVALLGAEWNGEPSVAVPCPLHTYQSKTGNATACTPCPNGLRTAAEGASGVALCLAPPGATLPPGGGNVTDCPRGTYKDSWGLKPCTPCPAGLDTAEPGAVAAGACYIPPGMGIELDQETGTRRAAPCVRGTYGQDEPNFNVRGGACTPCPDGTTTRDVLAGEPAAAGYTSADACLLIPGMGEGEGGPGVVGECAAGSYSPGYEQRWCTACPAAFTTLEAGATSKDACVVQPGWAMGGNDAQPRPCDKGSYSAGGTLQQPGGACTPCPAGWTTQQGASEGASDCMLCLAGYGGAGCKQCPPGTFSHGEAAADAECHACPAGATSAPGAGSDADCVAQFPLETAAVYVTLPLSNEAAWADTPAGAASDDACRAACGDGCLAFRYALTPRGTASGAAPCQRLLADAALQAPGAAAPRAALGFKAYAAGAAHDFSFSYVPDALIVGQPLASLPPGGSLAECTGACARRDECVAVRVKTAPGPGGGGLAACGLYTHALDADWRASYRIDPRGLLAGGFAVADPPARLGRCASPPPGDEQRRRAQPRLARLARPVAAARAGAAPAPARRRLGTARAASAETATVPEISFAVERDWSGDGGGATARAPSPRASPLNWCEPTAYTVDNVAAADAARFALHPSVGFWAAHNTRFSSRSISQAEPTPEDASRRRLADLAATVRELLATSALADAESAAYWAYHLGRAGFFLAASASGAVAHHVAAQLAALRAGAPAGRTPFQNLSANAASEVANRLSEAVAVFRQDLDCIKAGAFKAPWDMTTPANRQYNPLYVLTKSVQFVGEAVATLDRRMAAGPAHNWFSSNLGYPAYYAANTFHYQSDGWFSDSSADIYEFSTEALFFGRQDAMQRTALLAISAHLARTGADPARLRLLETCCGTGRLHTFIKDNWPRMSSVAADLSPFYLAKARDNVAAWKAQRAPGLDLGGADGTGTEFVQAAAEALPLPDGSVDVVVQMYAAHEMPEDARVAAAAEAFRVLRPGGLAVLTDSVQLGDRPEWDATLGAFGNFNEPHYTNFIACDFGALFESVGFVCDTKYVSSATKTLSFVKPAAAPADADEAATPAEAGAEAPARGAPELN